MRWFIAGSLFVAILGLGVAGCTQTEGERCQLASDCEGLVCVNATGTFESDLTAGGACTISSECGHCCPACSSGSPRWEVATSQCTCTSAPVDGDADADVDADAETDADVDADADAGDGDTPDAEG
jgi:hypothetical protein